MVNAACSPHTSSFNEVYSLVSSALGRDGIMQPDIQAAAQE